MLEFLPQTLPLPLYFILIYSLQFTFILLTLSPPKTNFRFYIICFILLIYFLLPLNYGYHYNCTVQGIVPVMVVTYVWKMMIWLKNCKYPSTKEDKIIKPFYHSLFWWRNPSFIIINQEKRIDQNDLPILPLRYILTRLISFIKISVILEFWLIFVESYIPTNLPSTPYPIRVFQYFTSPSDQPFFLTPFYAFYCVIYAGIIYWNMIWIYEIYLLIASCLLYYIQSTKIVKTTPSYNKLLIKLGIPQNYSSNVERWLHHFLFHTPLLFNSPHLSCSPSEFWSKRWHLLYRNCFVELGYLPCKKFIYQYYPSSLPLKNEFAHITGIFSAFWLSALFHEYVVHSLFGSATGEHFTLFLFHGIIAIVWEVIVTLLFKKNTVHSKPSFIYYVKKAIGFVLWNSILILSAPWFVEPYIRANHYLCYPHFGCNKNYQPYQDHASTLNGLQRVRAL